MKDYKKRNTFNKNISRTYSKARNINLWMIIRIWFSDVLNVIGFFFFLFSLPFVLVFGAGLFTSSPSFDETDPTVKAIIQDAIATNSYINDVRVFEYIYIYKPSSGGTYEGSGFVTGYEYEIGDEIEVKYKRNQPELSLATGMRDGAFGGWITLFILIFPLIGGIMLFFGTKKAVNSIRILKYGEIAQGKFISKESTNVKINEQTVYKLKFEFTAKNGEKYETYSKTHKPHLLEDDEFEKLVYDRDEPKNAVLIDTLPKSVRKYFEKEI